LAHICIRLPSLCTFPWSLLSVLTEFKAVNTMHRWFIFLA
jgi:hypothetical protein